MVDNGLPGFDMEEQKKTEKNVEGQMETVLADLRTRKRAPSENR